MPDDALRELIPIDESTAVYTNAYDVWMSPHDIALDLFVLGPSESDTCARAAEPVVRVRLPATMVFAMLQRLSGALDEFEGRHSA